MDDAVTEDPPPEDAAPPAIAESAADEPAQVEGEPDEIARLQAELDETKDRMLRIAAEYENYRKRTQREVTDRLRFASEGLLRDLLQVSDNLTRAVASAKAAESAPTDSQWKSLLDGVELTNRLLQGILARANVTEIASAGTAFDPNRHEAVGFVETTEFQEDVVAEEIQKGYLLHDRVLRPAMVRLARAPQPA